MTEYTTAQLEAWAGLGPWLKQYSPTIDAMQIIETVKRDAKGNLPTPRKIAHVYEGQRMDMGRIKLHCDALAAAPDLACLVLERDAEIARLRFGLNGIANLIKTNIIENDGPNRFHLDGVTYEGPEVDAFFRILRGLEKIARQAMKETSGELERLKEALELAIAANAKMKDALSFYADDGPVPNPDGPWNVNSWDFGDLARTTLADVAQIEGGKSG